METKEKIEIFIWFFLLIGSGIGIWYSSNLNELLDGGLYTPEIGIRAKNLSGDIISPLYIQDFVFFYDFTKQKGNVSFKIIQNLTFESIGINFPSTIKNDTWDAYLERNEIRYKINKSYWGLANSLDSFRGGEYSRLASYEDIESKENDKVIINFESDFKPKGRFNFILDKGNVLYDDHYKGNINFILGDDYQCVYPCIYKQNNIEEKFNSFDKDIRLDWQIDEKNQNNYFYINAISRKILFKKNLVLALSTGVFVASLLRLISLFVILIMGIRGRLRNIFRRRNTISPILRRRIRATHNFYEKAYPIIWNQFKFFEQKHNLSGIFANIATVSGIIMTFMLVIFSVMLQVGQTKSAIIYFISAVILLMTLWLSLIWSLPKIREIPYIKEEDYRRYEANNKTFLREAIDDIYSNTEQVKKDSKAQRGFIMLLINLLLSSFLVIVISSFNKKPIFFSIIGFIAINWGMYYQFFKNK